MLPHARDGWVISHDASSLEAQGTNSLLIKHIISSLPPIDNELISLTSTQERAGLVHIAQVCTFAWSA